MDDQHVAETGDAAQPIDAHAYTTAGPVPNDLDAYWMPFTANRQFKASPRLIAKARDSYYTMTDGRQVLDGIAGLWCVNAGHCRPRIVKAVQDQVAQLDYSTAFQMGHPKVFELATRLAEMAPEGLNHVFFSNSGSEAVESALKIALAYHRKRGQGQRTRLIGREKGYHGVNFGGISVGGIVKNREMFGTLLAGVDHLPHTYVPEKQAFSRGQPEWGAHLADELERIVALHGPDTVAAVIVEPVSGSAGVLIPPLGYLQRLREICDKHGILLIFDEVITGFGRLGAPFGCQHLGVTPDIITCAKGITNGTVPMGATIVRDDIHDAFMEGPDHMIELFHGYTYSGHPLAAAAALATLDTYREENLFARAGEMGTVLEEEVHSLRDAPHVKDVRNIGLVAAIELEPSSEGPTRRAMEVFQRCYDKGVLIRTTADIIALSPPLIIEPEQIQELTSTIREALAEAA